MPCVFRPKAHRRAHILAALLLAAPLLPTAGIVTPHARQTSDARRVDVVVRRFAFEPARIEARVGEAIVLAVRSADGVHGVDIRALGVKQRVPRGGAVVLIPFTAREAGEFPILCSEYCGAGHEAMKGLLVVQAEEP